MKDEMAEIKKASGASLDLERDNNSKAVQELEEKVAEQLQRLQEKAEDVRQLEKKVQEYVFSDLCGIMRNISYLL